MEFQLFLPQMRMGIETIVQRARAAEHAGFSGTSLMDHLAPPLAESKPMFDAMVTAAWLGAHTTAQVGHLVLCDAFRHPSVLARQAVSLDHATEGRFELGLGWGSVPTEFDTFGLPDYSPRQRVERMAETLEVMHALWSGDVVDYDGQYFTLRAAQQQPTPLASIPIVIGGAGPRTLTLVRRFASWWNCPIHRLDRLDTARDQIGPARISIQQRVTFLPAAADHDAIRNRAAHRFGTNGHVTGTAEQLVEHFEALGHRGVERVYAWFTDFADPDNLAEFGETVLSPLC